MEEENVLNKQTRVLALQLLDGNLHLLRGQLPTEDGRGGQVPPVARVTRNEKVVPVKEAEGDEGKVIAGGDGVSTRLEGNDDGKGRYARPDQFVHRAPLVCCVPLPYEWAVRRQQVVQTREGDEVHRQLSEVPVIIIIVTTLVRPASFASPPPPWET